MKDLLLIVGWTIAAIIAAVTGWGKPLEFMNGRIDP
jgi:hypothetical protein